MLNPRLSITVNGERLQMVFVDFRYAYNKGVCGIDDTRNDIMQQVEECARKLKREDYPLFTFCIVALQISI